MDVLWSDSPLAAIDIAYRLSNETDWTLRTVKTLLSRLVDKGLLKTEKDGRRFLYSPSLTKEGYAALSLNDLADRLFDGSPMPIVLHLARTNALTRADRKKITSYLKALDDD